MNSAEDLIANAKALLLDFDGPVTALMPPPLNAQAADEARAALAGVELPEAIENTTDHLSVLRFTAEQHPHMLPVVERSCAEVEVAYARDSAPSPEVRGLLAAAERRGISVAIVSNNSEAAVRVFLDRFEWGAKIQNFSCRTPDMVASMKPHPYLVIKAVRLLDAASTQCVLVGDSVSDVQAGHSAAVQVVGLAKTPQRAKELRAAGADALLIRTQPR